MHSKLIVRTYLDRYSKFNRARLFAELPARQLGWGGGGGGGEGERGGEEERGERGGRKVTVGLSEGGLLP